LEALDRTARLAEGSTALSSIDSSGSRPIDWERVIRLAHAVEEALPLFPSNKIGPDVRDLIKIVHRGAVEVEKIAALDLLLTAMAGLVDECRGGVLLMLLLIELEAARWSTQRAAWTDRNSRECVALAVSEAVLLLPRDWSLRSAVPALLAEFDTANPDELEMWWAHGTTYQALEGMVRRKEGGELAPLLVRWLGA
jgi:hypothetical protein